MPEYAIRFDGVSKKYAQTTVVDNLRLDIVKGEFLSLLGPSGSGKTTILMMLAGFQSPDEGQIYVHGSPINDIATHRRDMGVVFQSYALFPHMTVAQNVAFPLKMRGMSRSDMTARVNRALDMVQLGAMAERKPSQLSGGQQQRVALARALVFEPSIVLMDEPLGALDKNLREQMQLDIRALHARLGLTIVFVTHDQGEAMTMSDRIAVFNKGRIEQIASPRDVYDRPASRFVVDFLGEANIFSGKVAEVSQGRAIIRTENGHALTAACDQVEGLALGQMVDVAVRPERMQLRAEAASLNSLPATVTDTIYQGDHLRTELRDANGRTLTARLDRRAVEYAKGTEVHVALAPEDCWVIAS